MEGLFLVFVIIAMAARAIEGIAKGRQGEAPPQRPPQRRPRTEYERPHGTTVRRLPEPPHEVSRESTADAAADMIPDDLWQILTGQPKPQRRVPAPVPQLDYELEADEDEEQWSRAAVQDEEDAYEVRRRAEDEARARAARELQARRELGRLANTADKAPLMVSMERPLPTAAQRHTEFHARVDRPAVAPPQLTRQRSPRSWLFAGHDLKRAVILQEVLGTPKGLE
jgi:hypothetical protein